MEKNHILEYLNQTKRLPGMRQVFQIAFEHTLKVLGKEDEPFRISLTLVSKEEIHSLNRQYRDTDRETDVLTFAFEEADVIESDGIHDLGNIIISPEVAKVQAENFNHPLQRELAFLFIHGLLHTFGYDHHRSKEEAEEMFALQNKILNTMPYDFYTDMKKAIRLVKEAQSNSYSPYSHFRVGAVILTKDGKYHKGFSIENSAYGDSMCAERVALFSVYALGYKKDDIVSLTLVTDSSNVGTPCGSCRQVMSELMNLFTRVHIFNKDFTKRLDMSVEELLPYTFTKEDLNA